MAIDFELTPRQTQIQRKARQFSRSRLVDLHEATLHLATPEARFLATRSVYEDMISEGFLRDSIPHAVGGDSQGLVDTAIMTEELYAGDASVTLTLLGTVLGLLPVLLGGSHDQITKLLAPFLQGDGAPLAAFAYSEPGGSANAAAPPPGEGVRTTATLEGDAWVINGTKRWVSSATGWDGKGADLLCVVCRSGMTAPVANGVSIIAVERPAAGIITDRNIESIGHRAHLMPVFRMENLRSPKSNLIGVEGGGLQLAEAAFTGTAALVCVFGVALMRAAFDFALNFAKTERRGGLHPIIEHQAVGYALADAKTTIEAARSLAWRACHALDRQQECAAELAIHAKLFGSEAAVRVITDLMRIVGVESYDAEQPLGRLLMDALALPIFDGGNMGVRRKQLHMLLQGNEFDANATLDG